MCDGRSQDKKYNWKVITDPKTGSERNISLSYIFVSRDFNPAFVALESFEIPPPTHVIVNAG
jgi:hypothetical protein